MNKLFYVEYHLSVRGQKWVGTYSTMVSDHLDMPQNTYKYIYIYIISIITEL